MDVQRGMLVKEGRYMAPWRSAACPGSGAREVERGRAEGHTRGIVERQQCGEEERRDATCSNQQAGSLSDEFRIVLHCRFA